jgi:hypothetical protein
MVQSSSPFSGPVGVIIALVVIGCLAGLALTGSDLTHFITNRAKADGTQRNNEIQAQKNVFDLEQYKKIQALETEIQIKKMEGELQSYSQQLVQQSEKTQRKDALDMEMNRLFRTALILTLTASIVVLVIAVAVRIILNSNRRVSTILVASPKDPWQSPSYRSQKIRQARRQEALSRISLDPWYTPTSYPQGVPVFWPGPKEKQSIFR